MQIVGADVAKGTGVGSDVGFFPSISIGDKGPGAHSGDLVASTGAGVGSSVGAGVSVTGATGLRVAITQVKVGFLVGSAEGSGVMGALVATVQVRTGFLVGLAEVGS